MLRAAVEEPEVTRWPGWTAPVTAEMSALASLIVAALEHAATSQDGHVGSAPVDGGHGGDPQTWAGLAERLVLEADTRPELVALAAALGGERCELISRQLALLTAGVVRQRYWGWR
jgi:hypothetical protein